MFHSRILLAPLPASFCLRRFRTQTGPTSASDRSLVLDLLLNSNTTSTPTLFIIKIYIFFFYFFFVWWGSTRYPADIEPDAFANLSLLLGIFYLDAPLLSAWAKSPRAFVVLHPGVSIETAELVEWAARRDGELQDAAAS